MCFPKDFVWGAAAASYQIEGSTQGVDGCGESVWDMCCKKEGFVRGGDTGFVACDHYNRYREDVALMKEIGLQAYRLSIMWPRVLPEGTGKVNETGVAFYDQLVDELLGAGVTPWVTLFHWDYPVALFEKGGWLHDDSPLWFEEYTRLIVDRLSDRVSHWFTLNEPACFIGNGHQHGHHAPGLKLNDIELTRVWHNTMLAHGRAVRVIRAHSRLPDPQVGFAPCFHTYIPANTSSEDIEAARHMFFDIKKRDVFCTTWNLHPCFRGGYPQDGLAAWGDDGPPIRDGDMELIGQELDFLGLNIYASGTVKAGEDGKPEVVPYPNHHPHTQFNWPITEQSLRWATKFLYDEYHKPIIITENGLSLNDWVCVDGKVHDPKRIDFTTRYLRGLKESIDEGVDVRGYFHWSIMDNFEWAEGFYQRFGLIHVNYNTQKRVIKDSGYWYRDLIESNGALLSNDASCAR
ncbi:MAG: beta-glucosidase [Verrucomicrobia bacterium]|nr:beta-glucosidase [Verrucomicrobiota bacterium]